MEGPLKGLWRAEIGLRYLEELHNAEQARQAVFRR